MLALPRDRFRNFVEQFGVEEGAREMIQQEVQRCSPRPVSIPSNPQHTASDPNYHALPFSVLSFLWKARGRMLASCLLIGGLVSDERAGREYSNSLANLPNLIALGRCVAMSSFAPGDTVGVVCESCRI